MRGIFGPGARWLGQEVVLAYYGFLLCSLVSKALLDWTKGTQGASCFGV